MVEACCDRFTRVKFHTLPHTASNSQISSKANSKLYRFVFTEMCTNIKGRRKEKQVQ